LEAPVGRSHRIQFPGIIYHVFTRGNEKMNIYKSDQDRGFFMRLLSIAKQKYKFTLYAYCLMSNHYHLLIKPEGALFSKSMQYINGRYSRMFNWKNQRTGHLFEKRYTNIAVEDGDYLFDVVRYIHLNPVRKRMIESPEDYTWSSHNEYISGLKSGLVDRDLVLDMIGGNKRKAVREFRKFVGNAGNMSAFSDTTRYINGLVAGGREFAEELLKKAIQKNMKVTAWAFRVSHADPEKIITETARVFDVGREELLMKRGKWNIAKKAAVYLVWKNTALKTPEISVLFGGLHSSNMKRIVASAENEIAGNDIFKGKIDFLQDSVCKSRKSVKM
jgi:putative transposase